MRKESLNHTVLRFKCFASAPSVPGGLRVFNTTYSSLIRTRRYSVVSVIAIFPYNWCWFGDELKPRGNLRRVRS